MIDAFIDNVAHFAAQRVAPDAPAWSMGASPDPQLFREAAKLGLFGIEVPKTHGGLGQDFTVRARAFETLAGADFGFAMSVVNTHNIALRLSHEGTQRQQDQYLPALLRGELSACTALTEPSTGSDFAAIQTTARKADSGWILNGAKTWIINGRHAGLAIVYAQCGAQGDSNGIGAFLVDLTAKGVNRYAIEAGFSQTSMGTGGFTLHEVAVRDEDVYGAPGAAFKAILNEINAARTYVASMCNGMMQSALDVAQDYGQQRTSFGKPLNAIPSWQARLNAARAALDASRQKTCAAVALVTRGEDAQLAAAKAKIEAVETAQEHLPHLLQLMGAEGLRATHPFTRHIGAAQIAGFTDGATNILKDRVAKLSARKET